MRRWARRSSAPADKVDPTNLRPMFAAMSAGSWILIGVVLVGSGIGLWGVAERTADGRIGRNRYAGIRLRSTRESDEAWVAGRRAAQQGTRVAAALMGLTGVGLIAASGDPDLSPLLIIVGSALSFGALIKATIAATRAAKDVSARQNRAGAL